MMRIVGMGQIVVSQNPNDVLVCLGLGSCVCVALYDPLRRIGAMAHVVLPGGDGVRSPSDPGKYADTAVPALLEALADAGASPARLLCYIAGGASVLKTLAAAQGESIGSRNIAAVRRALSAAGIAITAEYVGGSKGRSAHLHIGTGVFAVTVGARTQEAGRGGDAAQSWQSARERR